MSDKDNGRPAFPRDGLIPENGMTLRDWFAGQALAMLERTHPLSMTPSMRAEAAYEIADAMLEARK